MPTQNHINILIKQTYAPNLHPKPKNVLQIHIYLKCIFHVVILTSIFHTSHKHPTTTKILKTNITQWETHTMEIPPITKIVPWPKYTTTWEATKPLYHLKN